MKILVMESSPPQARFLQFVGLRNSYAVPQRPDTRHRSLTWRARTFAPALVATPAACPAPVCRRMGMEELRRRILASDMVVFVTPLYYFGMSAQLKTAIDRFYSFNDELSAKHLKTALIAAAWDSNDWTMHDLAGHYQTLCRYLHFNDQACSRYWLRHRIHDPKQPFPKLAYALGKSLTE